MEMKNRSTSSSKYNTVSIILLILTNILWGSSFILNKLMTQTIPILFFMGLRHLVSIFGFFPFFLHFKNINKKVVVMASISGTVYFFSIFFQIWGLQTTTAGQAGFITGLSCIMVPFMVWVGFKKALNKKIWIAVLLSIIGMAFLLLEGESGFFLGDILVLFCAILYALFIVLSDIFVKQTDVYLYSIVQLIVITLISFSGSFLFNESYNLFSTSLTIWLIIIYMGIGITTLTFIFQNWSQQHQNPNVTAIIFTLEPVFAAFFGFLIGNEILTLFGWIGSSLIFVAIIIAVIKSENSINSVKKEIQ